MAENDGQQERDEDGYTKEERKALARENARATYPPLLLYLFYLCVKYAFMNFEPFQTISDLQENVKTFLVGMSPACVDDTEYVCLDLSNVHSWQEVGIWANQSIIKPMWGNYGGDTGIILQYLSLGEEVVAWTRRTRFSTRCPSPWHKFVIACSERSTVFDTDDWYTHDTYLGADGNVTTTARLQTYDSKVNDIMPKQSSYVNPSREGFFYYQMPMNETLDQAIDRWTRLVNSDYVSEATEELSLQWIIVSPTASIITLVQVHFITDPVGGDIHPGFSIWSFSVMDTPAMITSICITALYALMLAWFLLLELLDMCGGPLPRVPARSATRRGEAKRRRELYLRTLSRKAVLSDYWSNLSLWTAVHWAVIMLGVWALINYAKYRVDFASALHDLEQPGPNTSAYARLMNAQNSGIMLTMVGSMGFMIAGFGLFEYFQAHPRLGEMSRTISRAANDIGHFACVFIVTLLTYACAGHFMYAYSYPQDFGTFFSSVIAMVRMITGEISYTALENAYGSTSVPFIQYAYMPVMMFYFGFFFIVIMIALNIFLGIVVSAYEHTHDHVKELGHEDGNVFHDIKLMVGHVARKTARSMSGQPGEPQSPTTPPTPVNGDSGLASVDVELPDEDETKADDATVKDFDFAAPPQQPQQQLEMTQFICGGEVQDPSRAGVQQIPVQNRATDERLDSIEGSVVTLAAQLSQVAAKLDRIERLLCAHTGRDANEFSPSG